MLPWKKSTIHKCNVGPDDRIIRKRVTYTDVIVQTQFSHKPQTVTTLWVGEETKRMSLTEKIHQFAAQRTRSKKDKEEELRRSAEQAIFHEASGAVSCSVNLEKDRVNFLERLKSSGEIDIVEKNCPLPQQQTFPRTSKHANKRIKNKPGHHQRPRPKSLRLRSDLFVPHEREESEPYPLECREVVNAPPKKSLITESSLATCTESMEVPSTPPERVRHSIPVCSPPSLHREISSPVLSRPQQQQPPNNRKLSLVVLQPTELKLTPERSSSGGSSPNTTPMVVNPLAPLVMPYKRNSVCAASAPSGKALAKMKSSNKLKKRRTSVSSKGHGIRKKGHGRLRPRGKPMRVTAAVIEDPRRSLGACPEVSEEQCVILDSNDLKVNNF